MTMIIKIESNKVIITCNFETFLKYSIVFSFVQTGIPKRTDWNSKKLTTTGIETLK